MDMDVKQEDVESVVDFEVEESAFDVVHEGLCPSCGKKMEKIIVNKDILDGTVTFHFIKLRCFDCKKEYLDLTQAKKYDLYLILNSLSRTKKLETIEHALEAV